MSVYIVGTKSKQGYWVTANDVPHLKLLLKKPGKAKDERGRKVERPAIFEYTSLHLVVNKDKLCKIH